MCAYMGVLSEAGLAQDTEDLDRFLAELAITSRKI